MICVPLYGGSGYNNGSYVLTGHLLPARALAVRRASISGESSACVPRIQSTPSTPHASIKYCRRRLLQPEQGGNTRVEVRKAFPVAPIHVMNVPFTLCCPSVAPMRPEEPCLRRSSCAYRRSSRCLLLPTALPLHRRALCTTTSAKYLPRTHICVRVHARSRRRATRLALFFGRRHLYTNAQAVISARPSGDSSVW